MKMWQLTICISIMTILTAVFHQPNILIWCLGFTTGVCIFCSFVERWTEKKNGKFIEKSNEKSTKYKPITKSQNTIRTILRKLGFKKYKECPAGNLHDLKDEVCNCRYIKDAWNGISRDKDGWRGGQYSFTRHEEIFSDEQIDVAAYKLKKSRYEVKLDPFLWMHESQALTEEPARCLYCGNTAATTTGGGYVKTFNCGSRATRPYGYTKRWRFDLPTKNCYDFCYITVPNWVMAKIEADKPKPKAKAKKKPKAIAVIMPNNAQTNKIVCKTDKDATIDILTMEPI